MAILVDDLAVHQGGDLEKTVKGAQVLHQGFLLNLLPEVGVDVGSELFDPVLLVGADSRDRSESKGRLQVEVRPELFGDEREHGSFDHPSGQEVHVEAAELSGAGPAERELVAVAVAGDQVVDLIEQPGKTLDLVDNDPGAGRLCLHALTEDRRRPEQGQVVVVEKEVEPQRIGKMSPEPCGLSGGPGPEQEEGVIGNGGESWIHHGHFITQTARAHSIITITHPTQPTVRQGARRGASPCDETGASDAPPQFVRRIVIPSAAGSPGTRGRPRGTRNWRRGG